MKLPDDADRHRDGTLSRNPADGLVEAPPRERVNGTPRETQEEKGAKEEAKKRIERLRRELASSRLSVAAARRRPDVERGLVVTPSALAGLNEKIDGGYPVPGLVVVVAPPKCGKSARVLADAKAHVNSDPRNVAIIIDLENGARRFDRRLACQRAQIDPSHVNRMTADELRRWNEAYEWLAGQFGRGTVALFGRRSAADLRDLVKLAADEMESGGKLLVLVDSLNRLPGDLSDRRGMTDEWIDFFEDMRDERECTVVMVSETARNAAEVGGYRRGMTAAKESGRFDYACDLELTVDRLLPDGSPVATDEEAEDGEYVFTVRVEFARDTTSGYIGPVASYRLVRPYYGFAEVPLTRRLSAREGHAAKKNATLEAAVLEAVRDGPAPGSVRHWEKVSGRHKDTCGKVIKGLVEQGRLIRGGDFEHPTLERGPRYDGP